MCLLPCVTAGPRREGAPRGSRNREHACARAARARGVRQVVSPSRWASLTRRVHVGGAGWRAPHASRPAAPAPRLERSLSLSTSLAAWRPAWAVRVAREPAARDHGPPVGRARVAGPLSQEQAARLVARLCVHSLCCTMFGGLSSIPTIPLLSAISSADATGLMKDGVLGVRAALSAGSAAAAAAEVDEALCAAKARIIAQSEEEVRYLGPVRELTHRWDLRLHFRGAVRAAVLEIVAAVAPLLAELITDEALICELACIISDPGAPRQQLHADTKIGDRGWLVSMFVALQDVASDMGGTIVVPRSHHERLHADFEAACCSGSSEKLACTTSDAQEAWAVSRGAQRFEGRAGDALLFDSRLLHCGGANTSTSRRRMLYVTWKIPYCEPLGSTYSLLPEYEGRFRLRNFHSWRDPTEPAKAEKDEEQEEAQQEQLPLQQLSSSSFNSSSATIC